MTDEETEARGVIQVSSHGMYLLRCQKAHIRTKKSGFSETILGSVHKLGMEPTVTCLSEGEDEVDADDVIPYPWPFKGCFLWRQSPENSPSGDSFLHPEIKETRLQVQGEDQGRHKP